MAPERCLILQKSLRSFAGLLLSPELAKSTCGLCEFVQCAQLSLERAADLYIFFLYQLKLMLKFVCFCVDVGIGHSFDVGVGLGVFCVGVFVSISLSWVT